MTMLHPAIKEPPTQSKSARPTLPLVLTMEPGVANMPEPMTREMTSM
jgi:hypothetical protein